MTSNACRQAFEGAEQSLCADAPRTMIEGNIISQAHSKTIRSHAPPLGLPKFDPLPHDQRTPF